LRASPRSWRGISGFVLEGLQYGRIRNRSISGVCDRASHEEAKYRIHHADSFKGVRVGKNSSGYSKKYRRNDLGKMERSRCQKQRSASLPSERWDTVMIETSSANSPDRIIIWCFGLGLKIQAPSNTGIRRKLLTCSWISRKDEKLKETAGHSLCERYETEEKGSHPPEDLQGK